jgi:hypothetical protein
LLKQSTVARAKTLLDPLADAQWSTLVLLWASEGGQTIDDTIVFVTLFWAPQEEFFGLYRAE